MFKGLDEKALNIVVKAVDVWQFKKDDFVIKQGEIGQELFIVKTGTLRCYRETKDDKDEKVV